MKLVLSLSIIAEATTNQSSTMSLNHMKILRIFFICVIILSILPSIKSLPLSIFENNVEEFKLSTFIRTLNNYANEKPMDLVFFWHHIDCLKRTLFEREKKFIELIARTLDMSGNNTRTALVSYGCTPRLHFNYLSVADGDLCNFLNSLQQTTCQDSCYHLSEFALDFAGTLFTGGRSNTNKVMIVITHGEMYSSGLRYDCQHLSGVTEFCVSNEVNRFLKANPSRVYILQDFSFIQRVNKRLQSDPIGVPLLKTLFHYCRGRCKNNTDCFCRSDGVYTCECRKNYICSEHLFSSCDVFSKQWAETSCQPLPCKLPSGFANETTIQNKVQPGRNFTFKCEEDKVLIGNRNADCVTNDTWSKPLPECVPKELVCFQSENSTARQIFVTGKRSGRVYFHAAVIQFSCYPPYYLLGPSTLICLGNNTWSGKPPSCIKITTCTELESHPNVMVKIFIPYPNLKRNSSTNSSVETEALTIKLRNGEYPVGTRAELSCSSKFYSFVGSNNRVCKATGKWSGRPHFCVPVCGRSVSVSGRHVPLIAHGSVSFPAQWPWIVAISKYVHLDDEEVWYVVCGGSIITENIVLTAAHCVTHSRTVKVEPLEDYRLYFGKYYRDDKEDGDEIQVRRVVNILVHPNYDPIVFESDIAVMVISSPLVFTNLVQPICLPEENDGERTNVGSKGIVIGWGMTEDGNYSEVVRHAEVPIVSNDQCQKHYEKMGLSIPVSANMICAGKLTGGSDACEGDSGGSLVFPVNEFKNQWVLEGIISWGSPFGCGEKGQYGGYTRIRKFLDWIEQFI